MKYLILLLVISIVVLFACKTKKNATDGIDPSAEAAPEPYHKNLHDIWVLTEMKGTTLDEELAKPRLELFPAEERIAGNGGCNELFGSMNATGWTVDFSRIGTTKMFCQDIIETERTFIFLLESVDNYYLRGTQLFLRQDEETVLTFRKVD